MAVRLGDFLGPNCRKCGKEKVKCEFDVPGQEKWDFEGKEYEGCPVRHITVQSGFYLQAFEIYKESGQFPNEGPWLCQPAKLLDAFSVIKKELSLIEEEKRNKK